MFLAFMLALHYDSSRTTENINILDGRRWRNFSLGVVMTGTTYHVFCRDVVERLPSWVKFTAGAFVILAILIDTLGQKTSIFVFALVAFIWANIHEASASTANNQAPTSLAPPSAGSLPTNLAPPSVGVPVMTNSNVWHIEDYHVAGQDLVVDIRYPV
jgi:hypothetical protein